MFILDEPYVSHLTQDWLKETSHPVLANDFAKNLATEVSRLNLVNDDEAATRINDGERVYCYSENGLAWIMEHTSNEELQRGIALCKNKAATRRAMSAIDNKVFFCEYTLDELDSLNPAKLPFPVVVKPSVGFVSFGAHVVPNADAWTDAIRALHQEMAQGSAFPESVIGGDAFIVESFLTGQEYALDMYYDEHGEPVILNVMQHDFRDEQDTSDHFYFTSKDLVTRSENVWKAWFARANTALKLRNFCIHVELRVEHAPGQDPVEAMQDPDNIHAIEFNPLRFAGIGATDLGYYAFGLRTYAAYLNNEKPDWATMDCLPGAVAFGCFETPLSWQPEQQFNWDKMRQGLTLDGTLDNLYAIRPMNLASGVVGMPFYHLPDGPYGQQIREFVLNVDTEDFLI